MTFDAFISYSHADKAIADAACATLEGAGTRCWIAPRDVPPGSQWAGAIIGAIDHCRVMVLIFSSQANVSNQIHREVERAASKGIPIIPLRIEEVQPTSSMEYFLGSIHWLDALTPPLEKHLERLADTVRACLDADRNGHDASPQRAATGPQAVAAPAGLRRDASSAQNEAPAHPRSAPRWALLAASGLLIAACGGAALYFLKHDNGAAVSPAAGVAAPPAEYRTASMPADRRPAVSPPASSGPCGGAVTVSVGSRCATPLSAAEERALKPKDSFKECDKCPEMVVVPAGSFTMGSPNSEKYRGKDEGPQHIVTFATPLAVGKFSVTVGQFAAFVDDVGYVVGSTCFGFGANGKWDEQQNRAWNNPGFSQAESHPVVCVSLNDATAYVSWLTRRTHKPYRLLTESEWEYAARGRTEPGTYPRNWFASEGKDTCSYANGLDQTARNNIAYGDRLDVAPCDDHYAYTAPVGSFPPNHFGLYDMAGNSWQWVEDCYSENYNGVPADGSVSISGDCNTRIVRGGSWVDPPWHLRAAWRFHWPPVGRASNVGFRVTRAVSP